MVQTEIAPAKSVFDVKRGDIWQLGKHRLMCGDACIISDVSKLTEGESMHLIFTSPPYLQLRTYGRPILCWDTLMMNVFSTLPAAPYCQVLVNLGLVYKKGEWLCYWDKWLSFMQSQGWRKFGWYVWDKLSATPGDRHGRLGPSFEFVFHLNKNSRKVNKIIPCKNPGQIKTRANVHRNASGFDFRKGVRITDTHKIPDASLRLHAEKGVVRSFGHPAVSPVALARLISAAYTSAKERVYDPFCGSGTTLIAAEQTDRIGYGMEIAPEYVEIALKRWLKIYPDQMPTLIDRSC